MIFQDQEHAEQDQDHLFKTETVLIQDQDCFPKKKIDFQKKFFVKI